MPTSAEPAASVPRAPAPKAPQALLFLPSSAYQASIAIDDDAVYVLTRTAAHRIVVGASNRTIPLDLGFGATVGAHSYLFWSKGALWEAPKQGGDPRQLAPLPRAPQRLVASGDAFAWLAADAGKGSLWTLQGGEARRVYRASGAIEAVTMAGSEIFFVERGERGAWKIGRVSTDGSEPRFAPPGRGRTPAALVSFAEDVYYQRAAGLALVQLSRDFGRERRLAENLVCSPFAVFEHVYCSQREGLVEVSRAGKLPRLLTSNGRESITAVAANAEHVAWISDAGPDQLTVRMLPRSRD